MKPNASGKRARRRLYAAPNAEHIDAGFLERRALYRHIERSAGMTVPQWYTDCMGESVLREPPTAEEIFAHVLKIIAEFPAFDSRVKRGRRK